jgi:hypothetical protein
MGSATVNIALETWLNLKNKLTPILQPKRKKHTIRIHIVYLELFMGIVKISDDLHEEIRKASTVMVRSINAQAEFWIKIGMLAETNPSLSFTPIMSEEMKRAEVELRVVAGG